jgi:hypothetical protein
VSSDWLPFVRTVGADEAEAMLGDWRWLVPLDLTPLFITMLGDWIFGAPDGSIWALSLLEGDLRRLAASGTEYNRLKQDADWLDAELQFGWYEIALHNGLVPDGEQCVGWKIHPALGAAIDKSNLELYSMRAYQSIVGQLMRHVAGRP